jgi:thiopurine S-methyltransferase
MMTNDHDYWQNKWQADDIGFHKGEANPTLLRFFPDLELEVGDQVFVPLCGKSLDMKWLLDQGYDVVGVELSEIAIKTFFEEHDLVYDSYDFPGYVVYEGDHIKLLQGDIFNLDLDATGECQGFYDRAALIALPPQLRQKYVDRVCAVLEPGAKGIVSSVDYTSPEEVGPPFNITVDQFQKLYKKFDMDLVGENLKATAPKKLIAKGIETVHEYVYQIIKQ